MVVETQFPLPVGNLVLETPGVNRVSGRRANSGYLLLPEAIKGTHGGFAKVLGGHRSQRGGQEGLAATAKTNVDPTAGWPELIVTFAPSFAPNYDQPFAEVVLQRRRVAVPTAVLVADHKESVALAGSRCGD